MKVIYLHQYFNTPSMAGGTRSYEMARRLVSAGHRVDLVTTWRDACDRRDWFVTDEAGIHVHWLPVRYSNRMSYPERVRAFMRFALKSALKASSLCGDVVLATSTPLTIALPGIYAAWRRQIPFVFEVRDMWPAVPISIGAIRNPLVIWAARELEQLAYRYSKHIIALAPGMADDMVASGVPREKVTVIPNGCDLDIFADSTLSKSPREEYPWLGRRKFLLYAGTLGLANGVGYLVRVAAEMVKLDREIRFVVIGDGAEKDAIRESAFNAGLLDRTFFMFDSMPKRDLVGWLNAADIVAALFAGPRVIWKDAVQNKFFDALAAGKPIANNFDGWQSRIAQEAGVGLILDAKNEAAAARQLLESFQDQQWLEAVPARARELARSQFERGSLASRLEHVLLSVVGKYR